MIHYVNSDDNVFVSKSSNNTVIVRVSDDDTAGIVFESPDTVVELLEGGPTKSFIIEGLSTEPLHDVTISLSSSDSDLIQLVPTSFTVLKSSWSLINQQIDVTAIDGDYVGGTTFTLTASASSIDPKYASLTNNKLAVVATSDNIAVIRLPTNQQVSEGTSFTYTITLSESPSLSSSNVTVSITTSIPQCILSTQSIYTFNSQNYNIGFDIIVDLTDNNIDEGTNANAYICRLTHSISSTDIVYTLTSPKSFDIIVLNDDDADAKLQLIAVGGGFEYKLKVVGPLSIIEGTNTSYGIVLDTKPTMCECIFIDTTPA